VTERRISSHFAAAAAVLALLAACEGASAQNPSDVRTHPMAKARSPVQVASDWGLLGSWRVDCAAPVSEDNVTITYADVGGTLFYQRDRGDANDSSPVVTATVTPDDKMDFVIDFTAMKQKRRNIIVKAPDASQYRAFENSDVATGAYSVQDGKFTSDGEVTPWFNRCQ
jgi:hypothetical protein